MATRQMREFGSVLLRTPPNQATPESLLEYLRELYRYVVGNLRVTDGVDGAQAGSLSGQTLAFTVPATPGTMVQVPHALGRTPAGRIIVGQDGNAVLYDQKPWTADVVSFKSSAGSVKFTVVLI